MEMKHVFKFNNRVSYRYKPVVINMTPVKLTVRANQAGRRGELMNEMTESLGHRHTFGIKKLSHWLCTLTVELLSRKKKK